MVFCAAVAGIILATTFNEVYDKSFNQLGGPIVALGDWNSDHTVDVVVVIAKDKLVQVQVHDGGELGMLLVNHTLDQPDPVVNVIAGDINHDGLLDLVVQQSSSAAGPSTFENSLLLQQPSGRGGSGRVSVLPMPRTSTQMTAVNAIGNPGIDFIAGVVDNEGRAVPALIGNHGCAEPKEPPGCHPSYVCYVSATTNISVEHCVHTVEHSALTHMKYMSLLGDSATADLDGDCRADLIFSHSATQSALARELTVYRTTGAGGSPFVFDRTLAVAPEVGPIGFFDVDADGDTDMYAFLCDTTKVAPKCTAGETYNALVVARNYQPGSACDGYSCCKSRPWQFPDLSSLEGLLNTTNVLHLSDAVAERRAWANGAFGGHKFFPMPHMADYDNDAKADFLLTLTVDHGTPTARTDIRTVHLDDNNFQVQPSTALGLNVPTAEKAFFLDFDEVGFAGVVVMTDTQVRGFESNLWPSSHLFLTALGLNGRCHSDCSTEPTDPSPRPYGVNMPGVVHKFFYKKPETMSSKNVYAIGTQLPQSQSLSLWAPQCSWGLGITNSYVETYFCGLHVQGAEKNYQSWPALLPNSELVVIDYPADRPARWKLEQAVSPSRFTKWIALATAVSCIVLSIPIIGLRCRELREDALERQKERPMMPL